MNTESYFSQYESPNIVIIPNMSLSNPPSPKRRKIGNNILVPIVDNATCEKIKFLQEQEKSQDKKVDTNINSPENPKKKASWASNYLQSIGLDSKSSIWQHKIPRKNASKRCVPANSFKETMTSNVTSNSTSSINTESEKTGISNKIKPNSLEEKSKASKNNIETQKSKTLNNKEKCLPTEHRQSQNEHVNTVAQKYIKNFQDKPAATTVSSTNKHKNNITFSKKLKNENIRHGYIKRPIDDCTGCTSLVEKHSLHKKTEKAVKAQKQPNSKMSTDYPKLIPKQRALNNDEKSNCPYTAKSHCQEEMQNSVKITKQNEKYTKRSKPSTSYSGDDLKTKYKTQQRSIGHVTSVKSVVKVTKKYDINDFKLTASKKNNKSDETANINTCKQENVRKSTEEILSKKKSDSKLRNIKHKKILKSPIKKQSHRTKTYRKIKLVINVVCNNSPISTPSNMKDINGSTAGATQNVDLDFLNDFDVDEIVQSLDTCDRETNNLESDITLNTKNCNLNSNMFPGAYDNDALDLIKILKGEEDDDLIKQSIEGTTKLFSSNNIRTHTPCTDNNNISDHIQPSNKIHVISKDELVTPIKVKEEKQEIIITDVAADLHDAESLYVSQTNYGNKIIYKHNTPTLNLCSEILEDLNGTITSNNDDNTRNNQEENKAGTNDQVINNDVLDAETNTDLKLTLKETGPNNEKYNEIIDKYEKNETISIDHDETNTTYKKETVKNMVNISNVAENTDSHNQHFDCGETEFTEEQRKEDKEGKLCNNEIDTTGTPVQQPDKTKKQSNTDIPNRKIEQRNIGSQNLVISNEGKTTLFSGELKSNIESDISAKKSTEVKDNKNNDNHNHIETSFTDLNQMSEQIDDKNKEKESSESENTVHKRPTCPEQQGQDIYKVPKNLNDKEKNAENQVTKDFNKSKSKVNNDCLSKTATSISDGKIKKQALLSTPLTTCSYKKPNTDVDVARKLEKRMFTYLGTKYSIINTIHQGKFSSIFKCKHPSGKLYALKFLNTNHTMNMQKKLMLYSLQNGRPKNSLFTVYLVSAFCFAKKWYILMDYYQKNLDQVLSEVDKPFCIESVQQYARQLATAVMVLKSNNMVHSDIKPQHILINSFNNTLKLCGFDNLSYVNQMTALPCVGTASYRAPELILGYSAGFEIDVWSTAMVLYEMVAKQKLLPGVFNNDILYKQICTLGTVPYEMIKKSRFGSNHFCGTMFMRRSGFKGQKISKINNIAQNNKLRQSIYDAYRHYWANQKSMAEQNCDYKKLASFITLLEKMLVMHPRYRIAIEYVLDNTFIYDDY